MQWQFVAKCGKLWGKEEQLECFNACWTFRTDWILVWYLGTLFRLPNTHTNTQNTRYFTFLCHVSWTIFCVLRHSLKPPPNFTVSSLICNCPAKLALLRVIDNFFTWLTNDRCHLKDWNAFMFRTCRYTNGTLVMRGGTQTARLKTGFLSETHPSISRNSFTVPSTCWRLSTSFGGKQFHQVNGDIFQTPTSYPNSPAGFVSTLVRPIFAITNVQVNDSPISYNSKLHCSSRIAQKPWPISWSRAHQLA